MKSTDALFMANFEIQSTAGSQLLYPGAREFLIVPNFGFKIGCFCGQDPILQKHASA